MYVLQNGAAALAQIWVNPFAVAEITRASVLSKQAVGSVHVLRSPLQQPKTKLIVLWAHT